MSHEHKYFPMDKMATFEPFNHEDLPAEFGQYELYERIEYVIMTCNCGDVIKVKVRPRDDS